MSKFEGSAPPVTLAATTLQHHVDSTHAATSAGPIIITEKEVVFSTAAAVRPRPATVGWWSRATGVVRMAAQRVLLTSKPGGREPRHYYPRRYEFLERSCMGREMDRL